MAWVCLADETGRTLRPPKGRTWSRRGRTPVVVVSGGAHSPRVSIAGLLCYQPGHRPRLIYRMLRHRGRRGEPKGFAAGHLCALLAAAHAQLGAPIVLVWDNLPAHHARLTQRFIAAHADWLIVYPLPSYVPDLNPAEGVWAHLKTGVLVNLAAHGLVI